MLGTPRRDCTVEEFLAIMSAIEEECYIFRKTCTFLMAGGSRPAISIVMMTQQHDDLVDVSCPSTILYDRS